MTLAVNFANDSYTFGGYTVTAGASASGGTISVTLSAESSTPFRVRWLQLSANGEFLGTIGVGGGPDPQFPAVTAAAGVVTGNRTDFTATIDPRKLAAPAAQVKLLLLCFHDDFSLPEDWMRRLPYVRLAVDTPAVVRPAVRPGAVPRSLFTLGPDEVLVYGVQAVKDAGVSALELGVFSNPADTGHTQAQWHDYNITQRLTPWLAFCAANDFLFVATGDDWCRTEVEREWLANTPWAEAATKEVLTLLRDSGRCVGIEVVDESPNEPFHPAHTLLRQWANEVGGVKLAWPNMRLPPEVPIEAPEWSDYLSRFHDERYEFGRPGGVSLFEKIRGQLKYAPATTRPWMGFASVNGPDYRKLVAGGDYNPAGDRLNNSGNAPADIPAQVWTAVCLGATGVRCYSFDHRWIAERAGEPVGSTKDLQTGTKPGDARWAGVSDAFNSLAAREPLVLGPYHGYRIAGPWVIGWWDGLLVHVNASDAAQTLPTAGSLVVGGSGETPFTGGEVPPGGVVLTGGA